MLYRDSIYLQLINCNKPFSDAREGAIIASCTIDKFLKSVLNKSFEQLKFKIEKQWLRITCHVPGRIARSLLPKYIIYKN